MRTAFIETLAELAGDDPRIVLLTGDLGYMAIEPFADRFPDRFFNVGVSEQNMVGLATGLAEAGFVPFVYSIAPFISARPYEFIRNGPVLHSLPVRMVGIGGGFEYGPNGPSHFALEDVGIMRLQPGLAVVTPADSLQTRAALRTTWDLPGPVYYRIGKDGSAAIPGLGGRFALGKVQVIREGNDLALLSMGSISLEAVAAADLLATEGIESTVAVLASVSPAPVGDLADLLSAIPLACTIEAHYQVGGLGSLVSEVIAEHGLGTRLIRRAVNISPAGVSGGQTYMQDRHGLSASAIACAVQETLQAMRASTAEPALAD